MGPGLGYYSNDQIHSIATGSTSVDYGLDVGGRRWTQTTTTGGSMTDTLTRHYAGAGDSPAWTSDVKDGSSTLTRFVEWVGDKLNQGKW